MGRSRKAPLHHRPRSIAMNAAINVRKAMLFGLVGAAGCLAGWLVGELFLWAALPGDKEAGGSFASQPELPGLGQPAELPVPPPPPVVGQTPSSGTTQAPPAAPAPELPVALKAPAAPAPPDLALSTAPAPAPPPP